MSRAQELLERLMLVQDVLGEQIAARDGLLRVGIYDPEMGVGDAIARHRAIRATWEKHPFLRDLYNVHPEVFRVMDELIDDLESSGFRERYLVEKKREETPKLHLKAQFFASKEAWDKLIQRPEWAEVFRVYARQELYDLTHPDELPDLVDRADELEAVSDKLLRSYIETLTPEERQKVVYYVGVGSHNMNYRSFMMDGEVLFLISNFDALPAMMDFIGMTGLCKWPKNREELNALLPPYSGFKRKFGRLIKTGV